MLALLGAAWSFQSTPDNRTARILHLNNRGSALLDQYKFKEAAEEFRRALELDDSLVAAHVNLGIAYFYDQKYEEAQASLKRALELDPDQIRAHYVMGLIYRSLDETEPAIQSFEAVAAQDPRDTSTNYYLGTLYMRNRDYVRGADYLRRVIEEEPYNASAHYNLAMAYNRSGRTQEGRRELDEFKRLQQLFGSTTVGLQYLEQGQYALAIDRLTEADLPGARRIDSRPVRVTFTEVARAAGLDFTHSGQEEARSEVSSLMELEQSVVPFMGSSLSFADFDGDGLVDLYLADAGPGARGALFRNRGDGTFEDVTAASGIDYRGSTLHAVWGDYDGDALPDLYLVNYGPNVLYRNAGQGRFEDVTSSTGTGDPAWGIGGGFVDYDHDGDLDLYIVNFARAGVDFQQPRRFPEDFSGAPNVLYRNNGDGTFTDVTEKSNLSGGERRSVAFLSSDLDNTRDVDFYLVHSDAPNQLFNNLRDGSFQPVEAPQIGGQAGSSAVAAADFDRDGLVDLVVTSIDSGRLELLRNRGYSRFEAVSDFPQLGARRVLNAQPIDFDNDGDEDLLILAGSYLPGDPMGGSEQNLFLLENRDGRFVDVSSETGLSAVKGLPVRGLSIADFDNDGDLDFAVSVNGASPLLFRNDGGNQNHWISVRPIGTNSNPSGLGVKVEVKAGQHWQRRENFGAQGFLSQHSNVLHFGLGPYERVDIVRILWPNGILQSEIDAPADQRMDIQELDRKGTSCPILYTWNGSTYKFQTDFLGGSAYGNLLAPGIYGYPDTDEYIKLNRNDVALRDGRVEITMNNQLEEVILFDQVELVVVDHPEDYEIYPDEKLLPGPPYQDFRIFTAQDARPPLNAVDGSGRSMLDRISEIDRIYAEIGEPLPFKGYSETHELVLDLGPVSDDYAVLLLHAWIDYADSTSNLAASQAGVELVPPYLQVEDEDGNWVTVLERMGFPAGLPKTMTVDLSGRFLSPSRKVRIVTNMCIYWDQILVASGSPRDDFRVHRLPAASADLRYRGYPVFESPDGRMPKIYDYDRDMASEWKVHVGAYTRFGDVLPLLTDRDDRFVITRSGDEIRISFDVSSLPEPPSGWVRDYVVFADGFGKDMDPNSAAPHFLGPLPFHSMSSFPYPDSENYPDDPKYLEYLKEWNTRIYDQAVPDIRTIRAED